MVTLYESEGPRGWSPELTLRFIEMYKARPVMWDPKNPSHKCKSQRQAALMEISQLLGIDRYELERKIKNLTSHYFRERRKTDSFKNNRFNRPYKSKWFCFSALDFLRGRNEPWYCLSPEPSEILKIEMDSDTPENELNYLNEMTCDGLNIKREYPTDDESGGILSSSAENEQKYLMSKKKNSKLYRSQTISDNNGRGNHRLIIRKEQQLNDSIGTGPPSTSSVVPENDLPDNFINNSSNDNDSIPNWTNNIFDRTDEFSLLGEEVAMKVRKLPTNYARCLVQYKIQRILFKAALGKYDYPPSEQQSSSAEEMTMSNQEQQSSSSLNDDVALPSTSTAAAAATIFVASQSSDHQQRSLTTT